MPFKNFKNYLISQLANPPVAGAFKQRPIVATSFRKFYERGDFPIALEHDTKGNRIAWKVIEIFNCSNKCHYCDCKLMIFKKS